MHAYRQFAQVLVMRCHPPCDTHPWRLILGTTWETNLRNVIITSSAWIQMLSASKLAQSWLQVGSQLAQERVMEWLPSFQLPSLQTKAPMKLKWLWFLDAMPPTLVMRCHPPEQRDLCLKAACCKNPRRNLMLTVTLLAVWLRMQWEGEGKSWKCRLP